MPDQVFYIKSLETGVNLQLPAGLLSAGIPVDYAQFIPEFSCFCGYGDSPYLVAYQDSEARTLEFADHRVDVRYPWIDMRGGEVLLYIAYPLIELQRQSKASLTCHAAAVELSGHGVLLLGKEGAGKSSVALRLCWDYGAKLVANDLCILRTEGDSVFLEGGTKFFFLRRASVERSVPDLLSLFSADKDSWTDKVIVPPSSISVELARNRVQNRVTALVHVDESQRGVHTESADGLALRLFLNENFSRYIRSTCTTMLGGSDYEFMGYIPSLDSENLYAMRVALINKLLKLPGIRYISGPSRLVAAHLAQLAEEADTSCTNGGSFAPHA